MIKLVGFSIRYYNAELYDDNGDVAGYHELENCLYEYHNKYDLHKTTYQIKTKKFICEALIRSCKFSSIRKWITFHKADRLMVIVPTKGFMLSFAR